MLSRRRFLGWMGLAPVVAATGAVAVTQAGAGTWYKRLLARLAPPEPWRTQHTTWGLGFKASREILDDDAYDVKRQMAVQLAESVRQYQHRLAQSTLDDDYHQAVVDRMTKELYTVTKLTRDSDAAVVFGQGFST